MALGDLIVSIRASASEWSADLKAIQRDAKELERGIAPIKQSLADLGKPLIAAGGLVTAAFVAMTKQAADYGDSIRDAAIRTGATTKELSVLKFAAEQSGASLQDVSAGFRFLAKNAFEAEKAGSEQAKAFAALGVATKDAGGETRKVGDIFRDVSDRVAGMSNKTDAAALAQKVLGRGATALLPLMAEGSAGFDRYALAAEKLGIVVGPEFTDASDQFNDSLNTMKQAQLGLSIAISQALLPTAQKLIDIAVNSVIAIKDWAAAHPDLIRGIAALAGAILGAGGLLVAMSAVLTIAPKMAVAVTLMTGPIGIATIAVTALAAAFIAFPKIRAPILDTIEVIVKGFAFLGSMVLSEVQAIGAVLRGDVLGALEITSSAFRKAQARMADAGFTFRDVVAGISGSIADLVTKVNPVPDAFDKIPPPVDAAAKALAALKESVTGSAADFRLLITAVQQLEAAHVPMVAIASALGPKFIAIREQMNLMNQDIPRLVDSYANLAQIMKRVQDFKFTDGLAAEAEAGRVALDATAKLVLENAARVALAKSQYSADEMRNLAKVGQATITNVKIGIDAATDLAKINKDLFDAAFKDANEKTAALAKAHEAAAVRADQAWKNAVANLNTRISEAFAKAIISGENFKESMVNILKSTAEGMLSAFISGFISPATNWLGELGRQAAGALGIGGGGAGGNIGGGGGSGGLGGLFGGSSGGAIAGIAGGAAAFYGGFKIGQGIGQAWQNSKKRVEAADLVKKVEDPFWKRFLEIMPSDKPAELAALDPGLAINAGEQLRQLIDWYLGAVDSFTKQNIKGFQPAHQMLAAQQSMANVQPRVLPLLEALRQAVTAGGMVPHFTDGGISSKRQLAMVERNEMMIPEAIWSRAAGQGRTGGIDPNVNVYLTSNPSVVVNDASDPRRTLHIVIDALSTDRELLLTKATRAIKAAFPAVNTVPNPA